MRILIADDNREVRSALRLALHEVIGQPSATAEAHPDGLTVHEATNMAELLVALVQHRDFTLLLLDWELPGLDPARTIPAIRAQEPHCIVMALSGRIEAERQARTLGVDHFVGKNDPPARLLAVLCDLLVSPA